MKGTFNVRMCDLVLYTEENRLSDEFTKYDCPKLRILAISLSYYTSRVSAVAAWTEGSQNSSVILNMYNY